MFNEKMTDLLFEQMLPNLQDLADRTNELSETTQALIESDAL
jgi:hypothetical protein